MRSPNSENISWTRCMNWIGKLKKADAEDFRRARAEKDLRRARTECQKDIAQVEKEILTEVGSHTERLETKCQQVQSNQTRALLDVWNDTQKNHRGANGMVHRLENQKSTLSTVMISPKERLVSIEGIFRIPDMTEIEMTTFECLESGMTSSNKSIKVTTKVYSHSMRVRMGGQDIQESILPPKLQNMTTIGMHENNRPSWMNDVIVRLPDGNVCTGGNVLNVDPQIRKTQTGITMIKRSDHTPQRSDHPPPPPYRPMDSMTSGGQILRLPPNPHEHPHEYPPSNGAAVWALHDEHTSGIGGGSTRIFAWR